MAFFPLREFTGEMNTEVVDALLPPNTVRLVQNMDGDAIGGFRIRKGTTLIGAQITDNKTCLGLHDFQDSGAGANDQQLVAFNNTADTNTVLSYLGGGGWTTVTGGDGFTANSKLRFANFLDYIFIVNDKSTAPLSWDGDITQSLGSTHLASAPSGKFINVFKSRLYIAGTSANPDRVFYSTVPDFDGNITWDTTSTGTWIDINPADGMNITGMINTGTIQLIFKERAMYRWNGYSTDANLVVDVGTTSQESLSSRNGVVFFFNPYGFWITDGGFPIRISKPIQRFIDAISPSYYADVSTATDDDHMYGSIGDVTVDGVLYSNVVVKYTISQKTWSIRTYPTQVRIINNYIDDSGNYNVVIGDDDGQVLDFNSGNTDNETSIFYRVKTKRLDFGGYSAIKEIEDVFQFSEGLPDAKTQIYIDGKTSSSKWNPFEWYRRLRGFKRRFRYLELEVTGESQEFGGEFFGWEIVNVEMKGTE